MFAGEEPKPEEEKKEEKPAKPEEGKKEAPVEEEAKKEAPVEEEAKKEAEPVPIIPAEPGAVKPVASLSLFFP